MERMGNAFQLMAETQQQQLEIARRGQEAGVQRSLKIEHKLTKIGTSHIGKVPFEINKFEKELPS